MKTVALPSGGTAKIVTFFTRGEKKDINKKRWGGARAVQQDDTSVQIVDIPINQVDLERDAIVFNGTKFVGEVAFTENELDALDSDDFDFLFEELSPVFVGKKKKN